ncbi:aldehyde dehydrogenase family protein [Oceanobacillus bengalensis]|uniref:Aldehyde dehydrogenase family protein n=1 Tax=Oceanobacillus bengalensis TaxID=1435466 RepID=A0A494YT60_9BACI|nr:aldehyde dehydrogenase family protein [Oceanobacillus bengalensis]RKQ13307.1 aldehyde dehydrogenase family protein [Oceanobacillus bengalensis]
MTSKVEMKTFGNVIGGKTSISASGRTMESMNPATGKVWAKIPLSSKDEVDAVVQNSKEAFSKWSNLSARTRGDYLRKIGDLVAEHADELAELETTDNGWVLRETKYGLIPSLTELWYDAAGEANNIGSQGKTVQMGPNSFGYTVREPLGVVLGITPWNSPLFTFTIKAAYALAGGNTIVIKPSEHAAVSSLRYGELLQEILPPGVVNVISGLGTEIGDELVSHKDISKVSLTGSIGTARVITHASAQDPKSLIFELGGKSPNIVFEDADLDKTAEGITLYSIYTGSSGQICVGGSRILIQRSIFDDMLSRMKKLMTNNETVRFGNPLDLTTTAGPVSNLAQFEKVCSYINLGLQEGGEIVFGGRYGKDAVKNNDSTIENGYWVEPTLIKVDSNALRICQEEIFGPVATVIPFDTEEEALAIANDTNYGLGAGVWTTDLGRAHRMVRNIESGNVWVNTYGRVGADLPFRGFKQSGYGEDSILDYTREKSCVIEIN